MTKNDENSFSTFPEKCLKIWSYDSEKWGSQKKIRSRSSEEKTVAEVAVVWSCVTNGEG